MSFLSSIIQKKIDQEEQKQTSAIKEQIYDIFIDSLSVEKVKILSNKLKENESHGCISHKKYLVSMQETFGNSHSHTQLYELIFSRFKVLKCSLLNQKEKYFVTHIIPLEEINAYELCCALSVFIKCEFEKKIKLIFDLTDIDEDGYLNEKEIKRMITVLNFVFCNEEAPIGTESTIVNQSLANIKVKECIEMLMYFPGELKEVLRNEVYINFDTFYHALTKIPFYKFKIIPCFVHFQNCLKMKKKEKPIEVVRKIKDDFLKVSSDILSSVKMTPNSNTDLKIKFPSIKSNKIEAAKKSTESSSRQKGNNKKASVFIHFKSSFKNLVALGDKKSVNYSKIRNLEIQPGLVEFIEQKPHNRYSTSCFSTDGNSSRRANYYRSNFRTNKEILTEIGLLSNKHKGDELDEKQMLKISDDVKDEAFIMRNNLREKDKYGNNIMFGKYRDIQTTIS